MENIGLSIATVLFGALIYATYRAYLLLTLKMDAYSTAHGGESVAKTLKAHGVSDVFALCGGHISPILVGCNQAHINVITFRDERNAAFAADAYARISGKVGVVVVTAGPGLTNTLTAIQTATLSESPVLLIGGAAPSIAKGRGALQDIDQPSLFRSVCKKCFSVRRVKHIPETLTQAILLTKSNTPGPVFVEIPINLLYPYKIVREEFLGKSSTSKSSFHPLRHLLEMYLNYTFDGAFLHENTVPLQPRWSVASRAQVTRVVRLLNTATKPVIVVGGQVMCNPRLAEKLKITLNDLGVAVFQSGMARGVMGADSRFSFKHNRAETLREADLIVLAGVPCDFRLGYGRILNQCATIVSVNRDRNKLNMNQGTFWRATSLVHGDPGQFLVDLCEHVSLVKPHANEEWLRRLRVVEQSALERLSKTKCKQGSCGVNPIQLFQVLDGLLSERSLVVCDGGDFVGTAAYILRPRQPLRWLDSGPFGALGAGVGYAIGALRAASFSEVWLLLGDGACGFSVIEFDTLASLRMPVIAVVGNDGSWGQIERDQMRVFCDDVGCMLRRSHYENIPKAFGACGMLLDGDGCISDQKLRSALVEARTVAQTGVPVLLNIHIAKTPFRDGSVSA